MKTGELRQQLGIALVSAAATMANGPVRSRPHVVLSLAPIFVFLALTIVNGVMLAIESTGIWPYGRAARLFYAALVTSCVTHLCLVCAVAAIIVFLLRRLSPGSEHEWSEIVVAMAQAHIVLVLWAVGLTGWLVFAMPGTHSLSPEFVAIVALTKVIAFCTGIVVLAAIVRRIGRLTWSTALIVTIAPIASLAALGWIGSHLLSR